MSFYRKINLQLKFTLFLASVSLLFLIAFCLVVYTQAKKTSYNFAQNSLVTLLEHESQHLDFPEHHIHTKATTPHFRDVYLRISTEGELHYDSFPHDFPKVFPPEGTFAKDKLFHQISKEHKGKTYTLQGFYDLTSTVSYLAFLRKILLIGCVLAFLVLIPVSLLTTRFFLRPFRDIAKSTSQVSADELTFRFPEVQTQDEYGTLTRNFNALLDRLEKSFLQVKRFALNASHELRTPLAVIISQGELALRKERTPEEYRTALEKMVQPAKRLRETVNRLLFLAELDRLEHQSKITTFEVQESIQRLFATIKDAYGNTPKELEIMGASENTQFIGLREVFDIIVGNLLENAYKFSASKIQVSFKKEQEGLVLKVEDNGPGIPEEFLATALEPLSRASKAVATHPDKRGSGLGLSIVKACIDSINGRISLEKSSLGGLAVTVKFPQVAPLA